MMSEENNGNRKGTTGRVGSSNEDLSEYTDADESISAPTEFLAEFLSALMLKDYTTALKYCKLILQYEPNNTTAKEFYPLILDKIQQMPYNSPSDSESEGDDDDENDNDDEGDSKSTHSDSLDQDVIDSGEERTTSSEKDDESVPSLEMSLSDNLKPDLNMENEQPTGTKGSDGTTNSYSSLEDEEVVRDDNVLEEVIVDDSYAGGDDNGNTLAYKGYTQILPSSDEDYNFNWFTKIKPKTEKKQNCFGISTATLQTSSDSESPTDPVTQQTIEMLRAKFIHATN